VSGATVRTAPSRAETFVEPDTSTPRVRRVGVLPAIFGSVWLVIAIFPIVYVLFSSLRTTDSFLSAAPWSIPTHPSLGSYKRVLEAHIGLYFVNSVVVTALSVALILVVSVLAAYVIVRVRSRTAGILFTAILFGLAIPLQATIIPLYVLVARMGIYDTLLALILPYAAFGIPITMLILVTFMRDIPSSLFEAMELEGASHMQTLRQLVVPLTRPALVTVAIYNAIQIWNGFLFPLILTQSENTRALPLALWNFKGEYSIDVPAIMAAVTLSTLPLILAYVVGRRQLISGLTAGFGK
jgi:raffinose/stachyose/melibiose transport system permease protein